MFDLLVTWYFLAGVSNLLLVTIPSVCVVNGVCVCVYLLHMLLQLLAGRWLLNDLPWSSDLLVGIGSQKHSLIEVSHRQHILLILPVYGFTANTHKCIYISKTERRGKSTSRFLFSCCSLVIDEVLRIQEFSQKLIVTFQDLIGEKCEEAADWRETKLLLEKN